MKKGWVPRKISKSVRLGLFHISSFCNRPGTLSVRIFSTSGFFRARWFVGSTFLNSLRTGVENLLQVQETDGVIFGKKAVILLYGKCKKVFDKDKSKLTLEDLHDIEVYKYLLDDGPRKIVDQMSDQVMKNINSAALVVLSPRARLSG